MLKAHAIKLSSSLCLAALLGASGMASAESGDLLWQFDTEGQIWSDIQVKGKTAYFGSDDGNMYAVDIKKQELKWKKQSGGAVRSTPAFKRHWMFYTSDDGFLYAVNRKSGELFWKLDIGDGHIVRDLSVDFVWSESSPVIKGNTLYVGSGDGHIYAVSLYSGEIKWKFDTQSSIAADPTISGNLVYSNTLDGHLYAVNRRTGEQVWSFSATQGDWDSAMVSSPTVIDGKVITSSRDARVYAVDALTGEQVWSFTSPAWSWFDSSVIAGDEEGTIFVGSSDDQALYKFNSDTGEVIWTAPLSGWSWGTPTLSDDTVYIGSTGYDYPDATWELPVRGFQAINAETGEAEWSYEPAAIDPGTQYVHGGVNARVAVKNDMVFVGDTDGTLYVFEE